MKTKMKIKKIEDLNISKKRVLLRVDFNVPLNEKSEIESLYRVKASLETIKFLLKEKAKVILISHLGSPQELSLKDRKKLSLRILKNPLEKMLGKKIYFIEDCIGKKVEKTIEKMKEGEVLLLENVRFYKEEEENDENFAKSLANLGDVYINDAFSVSHRKHASIVSLPKFLPHGIGKLFQKEIENLEKIFEKRPILVIIGGIKTTSKIKFISGILDKVDFVLLGGKIAEEIMKGKGILIGRKEPDPEIIEISKKLNLTDTKIHPPLDVKVSLSPLELNYQRITSLGNIRKEEEIYDIGPETIEFFSPFIEKAKTIVFAGPLGYFEKEEFSEGTRKIVEKIGKNKEAFKVAGGGETILALEKYHLLENFDFISTGGGAILDFLSGEKLPALEALEE